MTDLAVASGQCSQCGQQGNVWDGICYQCMCEGKAPRRGGTAITNARPKPIDLAGHHFDSTEQATRAMQLIAMQEAGEISGLEFDVVYVLCDDPQHRVSAEIDARYKQDGHIVLEDVKHLCPPDSKHKRSWYATLTPNARTKYKWLWERYGLHVNLYPPREK